MRTINLVLFFVMACFISRPHTVLAEEVTIEHLGLGLVGNLVLAPGKTLKKHGVVLLLHDAMSNFEENPVALLQQQLMAHNLNSLAINLSLGLERRTGRYDCTIEQDHLREDALPEIHAWVKWLQKKSTRNITLLGVGVGGYQIALYGTKTTQKAVKRVVLVSPTTWNKERAEQQYKQLHGASLSNILFDAEEKINAETGDILLEDVGFFNCPKAAVTARSFKSYFRDQVSSDTTSLLKDIKQPVLIVAAELDENNEDLMHKMQQIDAQPGLKLDVIEGADQNYDTPNGVQVASRIKLFIDETRKR